MRGWQRSRLGDASDAYDLTNGSPHARTTHLLSIEGVDCCGLSSRTVRLLLLTLLFTSPLAAQPERDVRYRIGDDVRWAQPEWDDSSWTSAPPYRLPDTAAVLWVRQTMELDEMDAPGFFLAALAARDVYWDGVRIGGSGRVGASREEEKPGPIDSIHPIPDSLSGAGVHLVALRLSTFHRQASVQRYLHGMYVGEVTALAAEPLRAVGLSLIFLGGFVLVALYGSVLAIVRRNRSYALAALLCLAVAGLLVAESWRPVFGYAYDLHVIRLWIVHGLTVGVGLLLCATLAVRFALPRTPLVLALTAAVCGSVLLLPGGFDTQALVLFGLTLSVSVGIAGWAVWKRQPGAAYALAGVGGCLLVLLVTGYRFLDLAFFSTFALLVAGLLLSLAVQVRGDQRRYRIALAESARLEAELLKKHLQPHFLMNTLTSVMEWVETDPAVGAQALEALADELRMLSDVSGERLIPMARELKLCRAHLDVMGFRRDVTFALDTIGVDLSAPIPPAVLHTLVENAITHNAYTHPPHFTLSQIDRDAGRHYVLRTPLADQSPTPGSERGGLGYVRARLEESYPGAWSLTHGAEDGAWVTRIDLFPHR